MAAGDSGTEQSRLAAARVQRLKRQLDQAERGKRSWDVGAVDERIVADRLSELVAHGWFVLHDMHWPDRPQAHLDHVLVGPGGVVVVDTKNWTGEVSVSGGVLWQGRFARTQSVEGALAQCAAVSSVLAPAHRRFVRPLICLAGQPDLFAITNADVAVAGTGRIVDAVLALPPVLDQQTVADLYSHLARLLMQEPAAGSGALKPLTVPRVVVAPSIGSQDPARLAAQLAAAQRLEARRLAARRSVAGPRLQPAARPGARETGYGARAAVPGTAPHTKAQHHAAGAMAHLLCLAGFVVLAVYILPYWGQ